jgi:glycosyltransferase involved in cell wall biosynthesis
MRKRVYIVLNGLLVQGKSGQVLGTAVDVLFAQQLYQIGYQPVIVGFMKSEGSALISHPYPAEVVEQRFLISEVSSLFSKIQSYARLYFRLAHAVNKDDFVYFFIPGTFSLIAATYRAFSLKPFGIYLRGDLKRKNILIKQIYHLAVAKSKFVIAAGTYLSGYAKRWNGNTIMVVPMISNLNLEVGVHNLLISQSPITFTYFGRVEPQKGIFDLLEAAAILKEKGYFFSLVIAGPNEMNKADNNRLKRIIESSNLELQIEFRTYLSTAVEIHDLFKKTDVFVFPSHHEGFPRVIYEAMFYKLPLIVSDIHALKHFLQPLSRNWFFPAQNVFGLQQAMIEAIWNKDELNEIGQLNYNYVSSFFKQFEGKTHALQFEERHKAANV